MLTSSLLLRQRETKCRQKRSLGLGWDSLNFSFHPLTTVSCTSCRIHQPFILVLSKTVWLGFRSCHRRHLRYSMKNVNIVCVDKLGFRGLWHYPFRIRQESGTISSQRRPSHLVIDVLFETYATRAQHVRVTDSLTSYVSCDVYNGTKKWKITFITDCLELTSNLVSNYRSLHDNNFKISRNPACSLLATLFRSFERNILVFQLKTLTGVQFNLSVLARFPNLILGSAKNYQK